MITRKESLAKGIPMMDDIGSVHRSAVRKVQKQGPFVRHVLPRSRVAATPGQRTQSMIEIKHAGDDFWDRIE